MTSPTPQRTCLGCREKADQEELVRVALDRSTEPPSVVWDERRRRPGRGAWVHPGPDCLRVAVRRRAFHRAFRGPVDPDGLLAGRERPLPGEPGPSPEADAPPAVRPTDEGGSEI